ncbi:chemotaxis protein [Duganella sp. Leaf126]|uniref:methyl-accepting chemotaxis protein n=1 Tax=Duganella sp. Leaf126 TaxID=1736266 RepID=UPI0007005D5C|nr:methyl-accepting chemotaxis protein [Duganella sp. Leaf126]KQQ36277.1 chemotaxis protein [Duganella sp. Leaf126]
MKFGNLKIGVRLGLLSGLFFIALLIVGWVGWRALDAGNTRASAAMARLVAMGQASDAARSAQVEFKIQVQEWKNILVRGKNPETFDKYRAAFVKSGESTHAELARLGTLLDKLGIATPLVADAQRTQETLTSRYLTALQQFDPSQAAPADKVDALVKGMDREPKRKIDDIVAHIGKEAQDVAHQIEAENAAAHRRATLTIVVALALVLAVGSGTVVWLIRSITLPLYAAVSVAQTVAAGDLRTEVRADTTDEIGDLLHALRQMQDNLSGIVGRVRDGTVAIHAASTEIATGNLDLSSRTEQQAGALEETAASMVELTSTVKQNNDNANQAGQLADNASAIAIRGGQAVEQMVTTMTAISASSSKIVDIIATIDGIAFQTNILALNAAVEAARAGEQGRGFAVVATEVRNLAQRSATAAQEIKVLINDSVGRIASGSELAAVVGATMGDVVASVQRVTSVIAEITVAGQEQTDGIAQISSAISHMDGVTQQNAALVEEAAAAADALQQQAATLAQAVSVFKLAA